MARRRLSADERKRRGTYRPDRDRKPPPKIGGRLYPPKWLSYNAREEWKRLVPVLTAKGETGSIDRAVVTAYCEAIATARECSELRERHGLYVVGSRGHPIKAPWCRVEKDARAQVVRFAAELRLNITED